MSKKLGLLLALLALSGLATGCDKKSSKSSKRGRAGQTGEANPENDDKNSDSSDADSGLPGDGPERELGEDVDNKPHGDAGPLPPQRGAAAEFLTWKRYRAFEHGLMSGLELGKDEVCSELGRGSCVDQVHLAVLGGNEPYVSAQYERAQAPTILTSIAVERVVLAACERRLALDKGLGTGAVVFKYWSAADAAVPEDKVKAQTKELYRRLLAREATGEELAASVDILKIVTTPEKLALSLCLVVGTQVENVFL
jgi:hypothetical protein